MLKLFTYSIIRACQCFKSEEPTPYILKKSNLSPIAPLIMLKGRGLIHKIYGEMVSTYISKSCFRLLSTSIWNPDLENRSFFNGIHTVFEKVRCTCGAWVFIYAFSQNKTVKSGWCTLLVTILLMTSNQFTITLEMKHVKFYQWFILLLLGTKYSRMDQVKFVEDSL